MILCLTVILEQALAAYALCDLFSFRLRNFIALSHLLYCQLDRPLLFEA